MARPAGIDEVARHRHRGEGNDLPQVHHQDEHEQRCQERGPATAELAHDLDRDAVADEAVDALAEELKFARDDGSLAGRGDHQDRDDRRAQDEQDNQLDRRDQRAVADPVEEEGVLHRGRLETTAALVGDACPRGRKGAQLQQGARQGRADTHRWLPLAARRCRCGHWSCRSSAAVGDRYRFDLPGPDPGRVRRDAFPSPGPSSPFGAESDLASTGAAAMPYLTTTA